MIMQDTDIPEGWIEIPKRFGWLEGNEKRNRESIKISSK